MILTGKPRITPGEPCPSASLSTTRLTRTGLELNPSPQCYRPASNSLSHDTALITVCFDLSLDGTGTSTSTRTVTVHVYCCSPDTCSDS